MTKTNNNNTAHGTAVKTVKLYSNVLPSPLQEEVSTNNSTSTSINNSTSTSINNSTSTSINNEKSYGLNFQALKLLNSATVWQKKISKREWEAYEAPKGCEVSRMVKLYTNDLIEELKDLKNRENEIDYLKKKEENIKKQKDENEFYDVDPHEEQFYHVLLKKICSLDKDVKTFAEENKIYKSYPEYEKYLDNNKFNGKLSLKQENIISEIFGSKTKFLQKRNLLHNIEAQKCKTFLEQNFKNVCGDSDSFYKNNVSYNISGDASIFGVILLTLKILARTYDKENAIKYLSVPAVFELRDVLKNVKTESRLLKKLCKKILNSFYPFGSEEQEIEPEEQEIEMKLRWYSTIWLNPQLLKKIRNTTFSLRKEQKIWIIRILRMYISYANHILSGKPLDAFEYIEINPAQMGAGKTTVASVATYYAKMYASERLLKNGLKPIFTAYITPSSRVASNFAAKTPAHEWVIANQTVIPLYPSCPIEDTKRRYRRFKTVIDGDQTFKYNGKRGRNHALQGLSIVDQLDWFLNKWKHTPSEANRVRGEMIKPELVPLKNCYRKPDLFFMDPASGCNILENIQDIIKSTGYPIFIVDEYLACQDNGPVCPEDNKLAYWYSRLVASLKVGWLMSASFHFKENVPSEFDWDVLPCGNSITSAVSFCQLHDDDNNLVTPLNCLPYVDRSEWHLVISSWSAGDLRLFTPPMVYKIASVMENKFEIKEEDLQSSVTYLNMVKNLCFAVIEDPKAERICNHRGFSPHPVKFTKVKNNVESELNIFSKSEINLEKIVDDLFIKHGQEKITAEMIHIQKSKRIYELKDEINKIKRMPVRSNVRKDLPNEKEKEDMIEELEHFLANKDDIPYYFTTVFGTVNLDGKTLEKVLGLDPVEIALALSGIYFDVHPVDKPFIKEIEVDSKFHFLEIGNVFGVNEKSMNKVTLHGSANLAGLHTVKQAAGRVNRIYENLDQIGDMFISEDVIKTFASNKCIMDIFWNNVRCEKESLSVRNKFNSYCIKIQRCIRSFLNWKHPKVIDPETIPNESNVKAKKRSNKTSTDTWDRGQNIPKRSKKISNNPSAYLNRNYSVYPSTPGSWKDKLTDSKPLEPKIRGVFSHWVIKGDEPAMFGFLEGNIFIHKNNIVGSDPEPGQNVLYRTRVGLKGKLEAYDLEVVNVSTVEQMKIPNRNEFPTLIPKTNTPSFSSWRDVLRPEPKQSLWINAVKDKPDAEYDESTSSSCSSKDDVTSSISTSSCKVEDSVKGKLKSKFDFWVTNIGQPIRYGFLEENIFIHTKNVIGPHPKPGQNVLYRIRTDKSGRQEAYDLEVELDLSSQSDFPSTLNHVSTSSCSSDTKSSNSCDENISKFGKFDFWVLSEGKTILFGFIKENIFIHTKNVIGTLPQPGQNVIYKLRSDKSGRQEAYDLEVESELSLSDIPSTSNHVSTSSCSNDFSTSSCSSDVNPIEQVTSSNDVNPIEDLTTSSCNEDEPKLRGRFHFWVTNNGQKKDFGFLEENIFIHTRNILGQNPEPGQNVLYRIRTVNGRQEAYDLEIVERREPKIEGIFDFWVLRTGVRKTYGYIEGNLFVHVKNIIGQHPRPGQNVLFRIRTDQRGRREAYDVEIVN